MPSEQHRVTFLTGEEPFYAARKSFRPAPHPDNPPEMVDGYRMGRYFCWSTHELTPGAELLSWAELLRSHGDRPRAFHVHGTPHDWVPRGEIIERSGEFLGEPITGVSLIAIDVDGWDSPLSWWQDADTLAEAIHLALSAHGLDALATLPCVCMLSQGAWPGGPIKAHLYYWSDEPIRLEVLRDWGKLVNDRVGMKAVDGAVFRAVQPDYIARRECINFRDPIPDELRVTLLPGSSLGESAESFARVVQAELDAAEESGRLYQMRKTEEENSRGDGWELLERAGTGGSIDEYAYKAAARIVLQEGKAYVLNNLRQLAERMHRILWQGHDGLGGIPVNSDGLRGSPLDMRTYTVQRLEQFLRSACDRKIGNEVDRLCGVVEDALTQGPEALFSDPVLEAAAKLQLKWVGHFERVREDIRKKSGLRINVWQKRVDEKTALARRARRVEQSEAINALNMPAREKADDLETVMTESGSGKDAINEVAFCNAVMRSFDWLSDGNNTVFIDRRAEECEARGGYFVLSPDSLANAIRHRGMEIITSIGLASSPEWTVKRVSELIGFDLDRRRALSLNRRAASDRWGERVIATRYHRSRPRDGENLGPVWINLGLEETDAGPRYTCLRCDDHGVTRMTWLDALRQYPDAPVWGTPQFDLGVGANDAGGVDKLLSELDDGLRQSAAADWLVKLFALIRLRDVDEEAYVLTWLVAVLLDWDTKFILQMIGSQGSGKSSAADVLCALVDPKSHENRLETATGLRLGGDSLAGEKLGFHLRGRTTAVLDNLSKLTGPQQDRLCTIATGVCYSERILYTNLRIDHTISTSLILVGLYSFVTRPDLIDRTYTITIEKDNTPDNNGPGLLGLRLEAWRQEIITGLIKFAMAVRPYLNEHPELLSRRDGLYRAVNHLYWGSRAENMIAANRMETNTAILSGDSFGLCFVAWLQNDTVNWGPGGLLEGRELSMEHLLEAYKRWFVGPAHGRTYQVLTADGRTTLPVVIVDRRQDLDNALPKNGRALGRKLVRLQDMLEDYFTTKRGKRAGQRWLSLQTRRHDFV